MTSDPPATAPAPKAERWTAQWKELYAEVITTGLCTGCAGCVVTCPHDVIGYEHEEGKYLPFHLEEELGLDNCIHGEKGCTTCTRACPRFRAWEPAADLHLFGRIREPDEMAGIWRQLLLTRAVDADQQRVGQDGGFVSAMLIWLLEHDYIEAALVSGVEPDDAWKAKPVLARTKDEVLATAGSRYTYCANPLALRDAKEAGLSRLALVGMGCQTSSPPVMWDRKAGKVSRPFLFNIGLLCSKTFDDAIFPELFEAKYGLKKADMVKMNIKGVFQIWMKDGSYHEIDLKECHAWTRRGLQELPRLRRRALRHRHRRHRRGQRLDADHRPHRARRGGHQPDDRRRRDHRPSRAGGREGDEAAAPPLHREPPPLAGVRRPRPEGRRAAAQEEGAGTSPGRGRRAVDGRRAGSPGCAGRHRGHRPDALSGTRSRSSRFPARGGPGSLMRAAAPPRRGGPRRVPRRG